MFLPQPTQSILEQQAWEVIKWKRLNLLDKGAFSSETQQVTTATRQWKLICQLVRLSAEVCSVGFIYPDCRRLQWEEDSFHLSA